MSGMRLRQAPALAAWISLLAGGVLLVLAPRAPVGEAIAHAAQSYSARGVVQSIAKDRSSMEIAHEAIPGFMPAMTMSFEARSPEQLSGLREKDRVDFSFSVTDDGRRLIDWIRLATKAH
jgi:Cu/Ag efflux protein CusF